MMMSIEDTITIINSIKIAKAVIHESPIIALTENADTLTLDRLNRVVDQLTSDIDLTSIQTFTSEREDANN